MKIRNITISLFILSIVFILSACKKYDEGPGFSLRTKNARITGEWKLVEYNYKKVRGEYFETETFINDRMSYDNSSSTAGPSHPYARTITLNKDGSYINLIDEDGTITEITTYWSWQDGSSSKEHLILNEEAYKIIMLKNDELKLDYIRSGYENIGGLIVYTIESNYRFIKK